MFMVPVLAALFAGPATAQSFEETARLIISVGERELIESGRFAADRQACTVRVARDVMPYLEEIRFARLRPETLSVGRGRPRLMGQVPLNVQAWCIRVDGDGQTVAVERIRTMDAQNRRVLVSRPRRSLRICSRDGAAAARTLRAFKHMFENYCRAPE